MVIQYKKTIGYVCPLCSGISKQDINAFSFSGGKPVKITCPTPGCRETCVTAVSRPNKIKLTAECPICSDSHSFTVPASSFWSKNSAALKCLSSDAEFLFYGDSDSVDKMLNNLSTDFDLLPLCNEYDERNEILSKMIELIRDLDEEQSICCACGSYDIGVEIINGDLSLYCMKCRRMRIIESNEENLEMLLNAEGIVIGK